MARFTARKLTNGQFEIAGLDVYVKQVISHLLRHFRPKAARTPRPNGAAPRTSDSTVGALHKAFASQAKRGQLIRLGKEKDQLLRSLIPLYVARKGDLHLSSGAISRFWAAHGVKYAPPNAAKALREHVGYARLDAKSRQSVSV